MVARGMRGVSPVSGSASSGLGVASRGFSLAGSGNEAPVMVSGVIGAAFWLETAGEVMAISLRSWVGSGDGCRRGHGEMTGRNMYRRKR